ncbi:MAG: DEAD/DEAH box helicase, partial [Hydrogenophaga sp.]
MKASVSARISATAWLAARGWKPFPFQREVWAAMAQGQSGLLHATTGSGKTFAVWLGALQALARGKQREQHDDASVRAEPLDKLRTGSVEAPASNSHTLRQPQGERMDDAQAVASKRGRARPVAEPLTVVWITPMRALAADTLRALQEPLADLAPHWSAGARSGDTASGERSVQDRRLPTVLVTTPESLSVLMARADAADT